MLGLLRHAPWDSERLLCAECLGFLFTHSALLLCILGEKKMQQLKERIKALVGANCILGNG